jgi:DNA-binding transcriptional LysR family regulator
MMKPGILSGRMNAELIASEYVALEMHQVRYFLAVSRNLNFTRAAEECHVAQPSLTRAIKQLEDEFGGELFRRERNLSHLTELGNRMLPLMQQCFDSAQSAKSMAQSIKAGAVAPLAIALSVSINLMLLLTFLTELVRALPGLELRFMRGSNAQIAEFLKKGDVEVAVAGPLGETWDRLDAWPLFVEPYSLVTGKDHTLADHAALAPADLAKQRLLCRTYCEHTPEIMGFLKSNNADQMLTHQVSTEQDLSDLLEAGFGVGIAPLSSITSGNIRHLPLEGLAVKRTVSVYGVAGRQRSAAANTLIKMLRAADWSEYEALPRPAANKTKDQSVKA